MRGRWFAAFIAAAAVLVAVPGGFVANSAAAGESATLSQPVSDWLATASSTSTFKTIVTFDSYAGVSRIDTLGVGATKLSQLPVAFATLTAPQVREVASWPETRSIWHDQRNKLVLDESVPLIGADKVRNGVGLARGYTGAGVNVAVIDTGVDGLHPDLPAGSKVEQYVLAGNVFDREPVTFTPSPTGDDFGHGTHVSSTIAGLGTASGGRFTGVAPGAKIYSFKSNAGPLIFDSYALASFDWILAHPEAKIRVSSNSWGSSATDYNPDDPINVASKSLYDHNISVAFAAGNDGMPNSMNPYATSPWVIGVAAGTKNLELAAFSSRGRIGGPWDRKAAQRTNTGVYRPTLTAPGEDIEAAKSSQATVMATGTDPENPLYTVASGTSMATPHVAGVIALMLEARPALKPENVIDILENTANNMPSYELFEVGTGYLDALEAVQAAEKGKIHFPPLVNGKTPQYTLQSKSTFSGIVATDTWALAQCPDTTGLLNHHQFTVGSGVGAVFAEVEWASETQLIYLRLYDPNCQVAGESAALLDIGSVRYRSLVVTNPMAGTWTVGVYGRVNAPFPYEGSFQTYSKN